MEAADKLKTKIFYWCCALFIVVNSLLIAKEFYWFSFFPLVIFLGYWLFFSLDKLLLLVAFLTPLSFELEDFDINVGVSLPAEPIMFVILLLFVIKIFFDGKLFDKPVLKHPITLAVIFYLLWMLITSVTSEIPIVSFKYITARLWFVASFFFFGILLFKNIKNIKAFIWLFTISLAGVILFNSVNHAAYGFERQVGTWIVHPFFNDHTQYACVIALITPFIVAFIFNKQFTTNQRIYAGFLFFVLMLGILLSYSRAGWLSLVGVIGIFLVLKLKINFKIVLSAGLILIIAFFAFRTQIIMDLEKNKQDSSGKYAEHIRSISNISTDASNLERINRWAAAIRMFREKPVFGWGPGTYQLVYAPFQYSKEKTVISTNAGDLGNAHSEYIGPLSESGVLGLISVLLLFGSVVVTGVRVYKKALNTEVRLITLGALLGLCSYYIHGIMNNFLDTDKASVPFWAFTAIILVMDVYFKDKPQEIEPL